MSDIPRFVDELRRLVAAAPASADLVPYVEACRRAAEALQGAVERISVLEEEKSQAFRAGMKAEAYLVNTPAAEDG